MSVEQIATGHRTLIPWPLLGRVRHLARLRPTCAWRKGLPDFGEELADVFLYLAALAEMNGIDLGDEVAHKIDKNTRRTYERNEQGYRSGSAKTKPLCLQLRAERTLVICASQCVGRVWYQ